MVANGTGSAIDIGVGTNTQADPVGLPSTARGRGVRQTRHRASADTAIATQRLRMGMRGRATMVSVMRHGPGLHGTGKVNDTDNVTLALTSTLTHARPILQGSVHHMSLVTGERRALLPACVSLRCARPCYASACVASLSAIDLCVAGAPHSVSAAHKIRFPSVSIPSYSRHRCPMAQGSGKVFRLSLPIG